MPQVTRLSVEIHPHHRDAYEAGKQAYKMEADPNLTLTHDDLEAIFIELGILKERIEETFAKGAVYENII